MSEEIEAGYLPTMPLQSFLELSGPLYQKVIRELASDFDIRTPLGLAEKTIKKLQQERREKGKEEFDPAIISALFVVLIKCGLYNEREDRYLLPARRAADPEDLALEIMERLLVPLGAVPCFDIKVFSVSRGKDLGLKSLGITLFPKEDEGAEKFDEYFSDESMNVNNMELMVQGYLAYHLGEAFLVTISCAVGTENQEELR